jgi:hypothetical protein
LLASNGAMRISKVVTGFGFWGERLATAFPGAPSDGFLDVGAWQRGCRTKGSWPDQIEYASGVGQSRGSWGDPPHAEGDFRGGAQAEGCEGFAVAVLMAVAGCWFNCLSTTCGPYKK